MQNRKIIIIGGGVSGFVAGVYARKAGFEAEIYEAHTVAGGLCTGWERKGIPIDGCIHWLIGSKKGSEMYRIWETCGALGDELQVIQRNYYTSTREGGETCYLYADPECMERELLRISPADKDEIARLTKFVRGYQRMPIPADVAPDLTSWYKKTVMALEFVKLMKLFKQTPQTSVHDYVMHSFRSPVIRRLLLSCMPGEEPAFMLFHSLAQWASGDAGVPAGGSLLFARRMMQRFEALGGKMHLGEPVGEITVENGTATGVKLQRSGEIKTADYIISAIDAHTLLYGLLGGKYKDSYFDRRFADPQQYRPMLLTLVAMGVKADLSSYPYHIAVQPPQPLQAGGDALDLFTVVNYAYDPAFCRNGRTTIAATLTDSGSDYWTDLKRKSKEAYRQAKEQLAQNVVAEIERIYPELKGKIEPVDVATPATFLRYTQSYRGAYMSFMPLPGMKYEEHKGTIDGLNRLYLAGQWLSGGGLPLAAMAGKFAVQRICRNDGRKIVL